MSKSSYISITKDHGVWALSKIRHWFKNAYGITITASQAAEAAVNVVGQVPVEYVHGAKKRHQQLIRSATNIEDESIKLLIPGHTRKQLERISKRLDFSVKLRPNVLLEVILVFYAHTLPEGVSYKRKVDINMPAPIKDHPVIKVGKYVG